jgi:hypothetical protein
MEYTVGLLYQLIEPVICIDNDGSSTKWEKGEKFLLAPNNDKKVGPCFVALSDRSLLSLKVIKKISRQKPVMAYGFKISTI